MFFNARWLDPAIGRFAQADSIIPESQGVQAWDRYAFVNNNPLRYTDPTGHCADPLSGTACLALIPTGPIGWIIIGVLIVVDVILVGSVINDMVSSSESSTTSTPNLANAVVSTNQQKEDEANAALMKGEYVPPILSGVDPLTRKRYTDAIEGYKDEHSIPPNVDVPKSILDRLTEWIKKGKTPLEAVDEAPSPPDNLKQKGKPKNKHEAE
jgi:hypothetical protein